MKVLIIEDNLEIANSYKVILEDNEIIPDIALTANAALERIKMFEYDLLILDLNLPDIYGLDLLKQIKKEHPYIPVIVATARNEDSLIVDALELGADDYLKKPINYNELIARIKVIYKRVVDRPNNNLILNPINIDLIQKTVLVDGEELVLTNDEFLLLCTLIEKYPKSVSVENLAKVLYDISPTKDISSLRVTIHNLKRKFSKLGYSNIIKEDEIGYKICLEQ